MRFTFVMPDNTLPIIENWTSNLQQKYLGSKTTKEVKSEDMPTIIYFLESIKMQLDNNKIVKERIEKRKMK